MMERFSGWALHTLISMTVLCTLIDSYPPSTRGQKENFAVATASISLGLSFIVTFAHIFRPIRHLFVNTLLEMLMAVMPLSLWIFTAILIQNPRNSISSEIDLSSGHEDITYANLYFAGWLILFSNASLISAIFRDHNNFHKDIRGWTLLFTTSCILLGMSVTLKKEICEIGTDASCNRTVFAIALGACGMAFSFIAMIVLTFCQMPVMLKLIATFLIAGLYVFGVMILTSSVGPASNVGTMYFTSWAGAALSSLLFISAVQDVFLTNDIEDLNNVANNGAGGQTGGGAVGEA